MKVGIDIHGVIDADPEFFSMFSKLLHEKGHSVHVITGNEICEALVDELKSYGIYYDDLFSITTYHKSIGTYVTYKDGDPTRPLISPAKWDRTKGEYAKKIGLDIHIDDSATYGKYFPDTTQYILYSGQIRTIIKMMQV